MSIEKVKKYLQKYNLEKKVQEFDISSATVELASIAVGCEPAKIAKTLSFMVQEKPILIVVAGDQKIDNQKYKQQFFCKAKMLSAEQTKTLVGHAVGGVCPFAINDGVEVFLDISLQRFDFVYPACGSSNSAIKLSISELEQTSLYKNWVDVCKTKYKGKKIWKKLLLAKNLKANSISEKPVLELSQTTTKFCLLKKTKTICLLAEVSKKAKPIFSA